MFVYCFKGINFGCHETNNCLIVNVLNILSYIKNPLFYVIKLYYSTVFEQPKNAKCQNYTDQ